MTGQTREQQRAARVAHARAEQARRERRRRLGIAAGAIAAVLVVLGGLVLIGLTHSSSGGKGSTATAASASVVAAATGTSPAALQAIGAGGTRQSVLALDNKPLRSGGKPEVLYIGAEYCPFCAAERWSMVAALARFGTWSGLKSTTSAAQDVHPNTPTFSFSGARYTSPYLAFTGVETSTNQPASNGSGYTPLDKLTPAQQRLLQTYNAPPYMPASSAGAIPFVDLGGAYALSGAGYDPTVLHGKSLAQIADEVQAGTTPAAKAVLGTANRITAALCVITGGQPAQVCAVEPVTSLAKQLPRVR